MIEITSDKGAVRVTLSPNMPDKKVMTLSWDCGSEWFAQLLAAKLKNELFRVISEIRRSSYEEGYTDKTRKLRKREYFNGHM